MQTIDFLPDRYRERSAVRRIKVWQLGVLSLYGLAIVAAIVGQQFVEKRLQAKVDMINFEYSTAEANEKLLREMQLELNSRRAAANLYAYLQHRWPRTQILRAVADVQPDSVTLRQLSITSGGEDGVTGKRRRPRLRHEKEDEEKDVPPPLADLKTLRQNEQAAELNVWLIGETSNTAELHQFVADLAEPRILDKAELVSLDSIADPRRAGAFEFAIRVVVHDSRDPANTAKLSRRLTNGGSHD